MVIITIWLIISDAAGSSGDDNITVIAVSGAMVGLLALLVTALVVALCCRRHSGRKGRRWEEASVSSSQQPLPPNLEPKHLYGQKYWYAVETLWTNCPLKVMVNKILYSVRLPYQLYE